jgi:hypothetical protein
VAREWEVPVEETIARMPGRLRKQGASDKLIQIAQIKCAEGHKSAHAALRNAHYTDLLLRLVSWIDGQFCFGAPLVQHSWCASGAVPLLNIATLSKGERDEGLAKTHGLILDGKCIRVLQHNRSQSGSGADASRGLDLTRIDRCRLRFAAAQRGPGAPGRSCYRQRSSE